MLPCNLRDGLNTGNFVVHPGGPACSDTRAGYGLEKIANQGVLKDLYISVECTTYPALAIELSRFGCSLSGAPESWVIHS